jgi:hypothetical protein
VSIKQPNSALSEWAGLPAQTWQFAGQTHPLLSALRYEIRIMNDFFVRRDGGWWMPGWRMITFEPEGATTPSARQTENL